jgi:hypothetical protein
MDNNEKLYKEYLKLQSAEWKFNITGYNKFKEPGRDIAIKINFRNGNWLRAYYTKNGGIEWY